jgi:hypothetical protein
MKRITREEALLEHRNRIYTRIVGLEVDEKTYTRENLIAKDGKDADKIKQKLQAVKRAIKGNKKTLKIINEMLGELE